MTKCGKCEGSMFKIQRGEPSGSAFAICYVQCSSCHTPVGVLEYGNSAAILEGVENKVNNVLSELRNIESTLQIIQSRIR